MAMTPPDVRDYSDLEAKAREIAEIQGMIGGRLNATDVRDIARGFLGLIEENKGLKSTIQRQEWQASFQSRYEEAEMMRQEAEARAGGLESDLRKTIEELKYLAALHPGDEHPVLEQSILQIAEILRAALEETKG